MTHIHLDKIEKLAGLVVEDALPGEQAKIIIQGIFTSDEPIFYKCIENISNVFLSKLPQDDICRYLAIIHEDLSADIYVNDFTIQMEIMSKRDVRGGELVLANDIADIRRVTFPEITILNTDKLLYCAKIGWKFGLFFDFDWNKNLDLDKVALILGDLCRYLKFQYVYEVIKPKKQFEEMINDGWFPFIELLANGYKELVEAYKGKKLLQNKITEICRRFDNAYLESLTKRWFSKNVFKSKGTLINASIRAFLQRDESGYINCFKTLHSELEGILRLQYSSDTGSSDVKLKDLLDHVNTKGKSKTNSDYSLLLPSAFLEYLKNYIFKDFDVKTGNVSMSRHSSLHGVADANKYTEARALQVILTLDQLYFYL